MYKEHSGEERPMMWRQTRAELDKGVSGREREFIMVTVVLVVK